MARQSDGREEEEGEEEEEERSQKGENQNQLHCLTCETSAYAWIDHNIEYQEIQLLF